MSSGYAMAESTYAEVSTQKEYQKKKKKPGFIKRWFAKMSREVWEESNQHRVITDIGIKQARGLQIGSPSIDQPDRAIQFTVYVANGGRIVETRRYDRKTDRNSNGLYIITNEQEFGREIDKIITMEALK